MSPALRDLLAPEQAAALAAARTAAATPPATEAKAEPEPERFRVSQVAGRVLVVRRDGGGLVLDTDPASARVLAGQLHAAAGR